MGSDQAVAAGPVETGAACGRSGFCASRPAHINPHLHGDPQRQSGADHHHTGGSGLVSELGPRSLGPIRSACRSSWLSVASRVAVSAAGSGGTSESAPFSGQPGREPQTPRVQHRSDWCWPWENVFWRTFFCEPNKVQMPLWQEVVGSWGRTACLPQQPAAVGLNLLAVVSLIAVIGMRSKFGAL